MAIERTLMNELERIIDREGLNTVLDAISEICFDKATHIAICWQDTKTAKAWTKAGNRLVKLDTGDL